MCPRPSYSMAGQDGGSRHGAHLGRPSVCRDEQHSTPSRFSPSTRPQQEQIPPQRKFLGRLNVNNSRVRGWNTWRGAHLGSHWRGGWGGGSCWKGNQQSRHLEGSRKPVNVYFTQTLLRQFKTLKRQGYSCGPIVLTSHRGKARERNRCSWYPTKIQKGEVGQRSTRQIQSPISQRCQL